MGRTKSSKTPLKNLLAQAFGAFLKRERTEMTPKLSPKEVAQRLDVSESYYRLVESGGTVLSPSRADSVVDVYYRLEWGAVVKYLVAAQVIDSVESDIKIEEQWKRIEARLERISIFDQGLKKLYTFFEKKGFWELTEEGNFKLNPSDSRKKIKSIIEGDEFYFQLLNFFTIERDSTGALSNIDQSIVNKIEKSSSILVDSIFETLNNMQSYRLHFATGDSREFEKVNSHKFTNLKALITNPGKIVTYKNLKIFNYEWLWSKNFEKAELIFFDLENNQIEMNNTSKLREEFEKNLKTVYEELGKTTEIKPNNWKEAMSKVQFIDGSSSQEKANDLLGLENYDHEIENLWVFDYINGNKVGFVYGTNDFINGLTLTYGESFKKWSQMSDIIQLLNE